MGFGEYGSDPFVQSAPTHIALELSHGFITFFSFNMQTTVILFIFLNIYMHICVRVSVRIYFIEYSSLSLTL
ncbi:hypothetical protein PHJA_002879800 [Phtheirospermum japonicum]|uniref:Uncharacterized protein n=1 Tax=Phtheirospermum japonicum TaxID=374723 RepID=A0A830D6M2_9LAMI|nr:hypothetical protein PHJA_002879800 [Phtheirospermum japonicum]